MAMPCWPSGLGPRLNIGDLQAVRLRYRLGYSVRLRFAHARCADSQVVEVDADAPDVAGFGGMQAMPAVPEDASRPPVPPLLAPAPKIARSGPTAAAGPAGLGMSGRPRASS